MREGKVRPRRHKLLNLGGQIQPRAVTPEAGELADNTGVVIERPRQIVVDPLKRPRGRNHMRLYAGGSQNVFLPVVLPRYVQLALIGSVRSDPRGHLVVHFLLRVHHLERVGHLAAPAVPPGVADRCLTLFTLPRGDNNDPVRASRAVHSRCSCIL